MFGIWLQQNWGNLVIIAVLALLMGLLSWLLIRSKRKGKSCCGGCNGCALQGKCHAKPPKS